MTMLAGWVLAALAVVGCLYVVAATALTLRFLARRAPAPTQLPAVTLLKPLHGAYPGMAQVLEGFCDQDYDAPVQIVFGVQDPSDPAVAVVEALRRRRMDIDISLVIDSAQHGANRKISNVINIAARARHEVLVLSDADIAVPPSYLSQVATALAADSVGAVSCLYVGQGDDTAWAQLGAMAINYGFLPNAVLGRTLGLAEPCFGSTIALKTETLSAMGGFRAFANHLADDYEIGRSIRALGKSIAIPPIVVGHLALDNDFKELVDHELRWGRTVRQIDPAGYLGSLVTYPVPLALLASVLLGSPPAALGLILTTVLVRILCKLTMDAATGAAVGRWWLIPARDVLSFGVFIASFTVNTVGWQGRRFRVGRDGVLSHT